MSIQAVGWVIGQDLRACPKAKLVLQSLANHADHKDGYCWLRIDTIAEEASLPERSVYRYLGALVRNGYVRRERRKGADGKQRANDYWLLFNREERPWSWGDGETDEAETHGSDADDLQDIDGAIPAGTDRLPRMADGDTATYAGLSSAELSRVADGPTAIAGRAKDSEEPSESKPKTESTATSPPGGSPRGYKPPPPAAPPAQGSTTPTGDKIFVFQGTPAYQAWAIVKARQNGLSRWGLTITRTDEQGRTRTGWWFPTLFPPAAEKPPPGGSSLATEEELQEFGKTG